MQAPGVAQAVGAGPFLPQGRPRKYLFEKHARIFNICYLTFFMIDQLLCLFSRCFNGSHDLAYLMIQ